MADCQGGRDCGSTFCCSRAFARPVR